MCELCGVAWGLRMSSPDVQTQNIAPVQHKCEWLRCDASVAYFINLYVQIYDAVDRVWIPFKLWNAQYRALRVFQNQQLSIALKARQNGFTWLALAYCLHLSLFRPAATSGLFSKRDDEAMYLLGDERLGGMYRRLPDFLKAREIEIDNGHEFGLSNGSIVRALPTTAGDSYTFTFVLGDESDLYPDFGRWMRSVKPTIDAGGKMILISRVDKGQPGSDFKKIYRAARDGANGWAAVFSPWSDHPKRDHAWYERQKVEIMARTGSLDDLHEQYPQTDTEALAPRSLDKRIPPDWIERVFGVCAETQNIVSVPSIPGLVIYRLPESGRTYVSGADPAEGNPGSDPSACEMLDAQTGEEVAAFAGRIDPSVFGGYVATLCRFYNGAGVLPERNNHGHALILWLRDNARDVRVLAGEDGKPGWLDHSRGKVLLYSAAADALRPPAVGGAAAALLHSRETMTQLQSIEGSSLRAPSGQQDDRADAWALANLARGRGVVSFEPAIVQAADPLVEIDRQRGF